MDKKRIIAAFTKNSAPKSKPIQSYDRASFHDTVKLDLPFTSAFIPGGMLMGWAVLNNLLTQEFAEEQADDIKEFLEGRLSCAELYRWMGGYLHQSMFIKDCSMFLHAYYGYHKGEENQNKSAYWNDLKFAMQKEGTIYHIADSATNFARVRELLDTRYKEFLQTIFSNPSKSLEDIQWSKVALQNIALEQNSPEWLETEYKKLHRYDDVVDLPLVEEEFYFTHGSLFISECNKTISNTRSAEDLEKRYVTEPGAVDFNLLSSVGVARLSIQIGEFIPNDAYVSVIRVPFEVGDAGKLEANSVTEISIVFSIKPGNYTIVLAQYITEENTRLGDLVAIDLFFEPTKPA